MLVGRPSFPFPFQGAFSGSLAVRFRQSASIVEPTKTPYITHRIHVYISILLPAPSKGWCLNPKGLLSGTPYHPFGTPWRVQVYIFPKVCWTYLEKLETGIPTSPPHSVISDP